MAETLEDIFAQQPSSLPNPVPTANQAESLEDIFAQGVGKMPDVEQAPMEPMPEEVPVGDDFAPEPQSMAGLPVDIESKPGVVQMIREFWPRVQYAWAGNTREAARALMKSGKFEDVKIDDKGTIKVIRPGKKGYSSFDFEDFEIMGEIIDASRPIIEGAYEAGIEAAGTAGLALGALPTGGASLAAQPAVGAAAAVGALNIADAIAEQHLGVERDPKRSRLKESAIAGTAGALFGFTSAGIARRTAAKQAKQSQARAGIEKVTEAVQEAASEQRILEEAGVVFDKANGTAVITPSQATAGRVPELVVTEQELTKQPGFRQYIEMRGKELVDGWDTLTQTLREKTLGKTTAGKEFKERVIGIGDYFGENIGRFRTMAKDQVKAPQALDNLNEVMQRVTQEAQGIPGGNISEKVQGLYGLDASQAKVLINRVKEIQGKMQGNAMSVKEIDTLYTSLRKQIDGLMKTDRGRGLGNALVPIKNAIRDDYAVAIGKTLPESQKGAYEAFMKNYSVFKQGEKDLMNVLRSSDISKKALVSKLFEGKMSLPSARSLQTILKQEDPKLLREVSTEFFDQLAMQYTKGPVGKEVRDWGGMATKWKRLGPEMQEILLDSSGLTKQQMDSMLNLGQRYQGVDIKNLSEEGAEGLVRNLWLLTPWSKAGGASQTTAATQLAKKIGKGSSFVEYLQNGGAEKFLQKHPGFSAAKKSKFLGWVDSLTIPKEPGVMGVEQTILRQGMTEKDR